jgi:ketosteroid isomerase-like protein
VAAVVLLTVAALAALLATRPPRPAGLLETPDGVVTAFILAIQAGNAAEAWSYVSPDATGPGPPQSPEGKPAANRDEFQREVDGTRGQARSRVRILSVSRSGGSATVDIEVTSFSGSPLGGASSRDVSVTLARQGGSWLITSDPSPWQFT